MKEDNGTCYGCGSYPDDVLLLICGHNLCLKCAGERLRKDSMQGNQNIFTVLCEVCGSATVIDPDSVGALVGEEWSASRSEKAPSEQAQVPYSSPELYPMETGMVFCPFHGEEPAKYFCLDCLGEPICAECIFGGAHANHNVLHIKRAFHSIRSKVDNVVQGLLTRMEELDIGVKKIDDYKQTLVSQANGAKSQIKAFLEEVISRAVKKQQEIEDIINSSLEDSLQELNANQEAISSQINQISNEINEISANIDTNIAEGLKFYSRNNTMFKELVKTASSHASVDPLLKRIGINISQASIANFKDQLQFAIDSISGLHLVELSTTSPRRMEPTISIRSPAKRETSFKKTYEVKKSANPTIKSENSKIIISPSYK